MALPLIHRAGLVAALDPEIRADVFPNSKLKSAANLVVCPNLDSANIAFNLLKSAADGLHIGPMLLGTAAPAHVLTPSVTALVKSERKVLPSSGRTMRSCGRFGPATPGTTVEISSSRSTEYSIWPFSGMPHRPCAL